MDPESLFFSSRSSSASFSQESGAAMASGLIATASEVKVDDVTLLIAASV